MMRRILFVCALLVAVGVSAQTSLAGREYHHSNIMADEINKAVNEGVGDMEKARREFIAKAEEKKGRKLTAKELAEVDKKLEETKKLMVAMKDGMKMAITVVFKDDKNVVMKCEMKVDDRVMKAAGIGWAKRKLIGLATKVMPDEKATYTVQGNHVYLFDGEERDTMRLSDDGKYLYGKMDEKKKFKLTRTK